MFNWFKKKRAELTPREELEQEAAGLWHTPPKYYDINPYWLHEPHIVEGTDTILWPVGDSYERDWFPTRPEAIEGLKPQQLLHEQCVKDTWDAYEVGYRKYYNFCIGNYLVAKPQEGRPDV